MKRILSIVYNYYHSDPRATKFNTSLSEEYEVTVLSLRENAKHSEDGCVKHVYVPRKRISIIALLYFWYHTLKNILHFKPDIIIAHNYFVLLPCVIGAKVVRAKIVYDSYELYVPTKRICLSKRQYLFYYTEKISIVGCDLVIAANIERGRLMKKKFNLENTPLSILNISASACAKQEDKALVKKKYKCLSENKKKIIYQGFMSMERELDLYLDFMEFLPSDYLLIYVGGGPDLNYIKELVKRRNLTNKVTCIGQVPMSDIVPIVSCCDLGLVTYPFTDYNNRYCSPNKIFEYSLALIPFISSKQTSIQTIMKDVNYVCYIDLYNPQKAADSIEHFVKTYKYSIEEFDRFNKKYQWSVEANKLLHEIRLII